MNQTDSVHGQMADCRLATFVHWLRRLEDLIVERRLRWLGHVARMEDHSLVTSATSSTRDQDEWRDRVRRDLKKFGIEESGWYCRAQLGQEGLEDRLQDRTRGCDRCQIGER